MNDPLERLVGVGARGGGGGGGVACPDRRGTTMTLVCVDCKKLACETCIALTHSTRPQAVVRNELV